MGARALCNNWSSSNGGRVCGSRYYLGIRRGVFFWRLFLLAQKKFLQDFSLAVYVFLVMLYSMLFLLLF